MGQDYPGFLTATHREYLSATESERREMRKKNPNISRRIRERMNGAKKDWALIYQSEASVVGDVDLTREHVGERLQLQTDSSISSGIESAQAQKRAYMGDGLVELDGKTVDECLDELEGEQSEVHRVVAESIVESLIDFENEADVFSKEEMERFVDLIYPEKEEALEIVAEKLSDH